jgi:hypothetical protein
VFTHRIEVYHAVIGRLAPDLDASRRRPRCPASAANPTRVDTDTATPASESGVGEGFAWVDAAGFRRLAVATAHRRLARMAGLPTAGPQRLP